MKKLFLMGIISSLLSVFSCTAQNEGFRSVEANEFERIIADTAVVRLDVRTAEEYAEGHIANARNIDVLQDDFEKTALSTLPKDKTIALYCRSGKRSKKAASILVKHQYKIIELNSGFNGWRGAGKAIENVFVKP